MENLNFWLELADLLVWLYSRIIVQGPLSKVILSSSHDLLQSIYQPTTLNQLLKNILSDTSVSIIVKIYLKIDFCLLLLVTFPEV